MFDQSKITRAEWSALKGAGVTFTHSDGKTVRLDKDATSKRIAAYIKTHATVSTDDEFKANGVSLDALVQNVLGLPITMSEETKEGIEKYIVDRMAGTAVGDVQSEFDDLWLIKSRFERIFKSTVDLSEIVQKVTLWAVSSDTEMITRHAVLPSHKRVLAFEKGNLRDSIEQAQRVPKLAAQLMAVQIQRSQLVALATETARLRITGGMSADQLASFEQDVAAKLVQLDAAMSDNKLAITAA